MNWVLALGEGSVFSTLFAVNLRHLMHLTVLLGMRF